MKVYPDRVQKNLSEVHIPASGIPAPGSGDPFTMRFVVLKIFLPGP
jgi:hypothetical protein